jgi:hypothetical protein
MTGSTLKGGWESLTDLVLGLYQALCRTLEREQDGGAE